MIVLVCLNSSLFSSLALTNIQPSLCIQKIDQTILGTRIRGPIFYLLRRILYDYYVHIQTLRKLLVRVLQPF